MARKCSCCPETTSGTLSRNGWMAVIDAKPGKLLLLCDYCAAALRELIRSGMLATMDAPGYAAPEADDAFSAAEQGV